MNKQELETRVANLEAIVTELQKKNEKAVKESLPWWEAISETFADNPAFEEAMRLGREYRINTKVEDEFDEE